MWRNAFLGTPSNSYDERFRVRILPFLFTLIGMIPAIAWESDASVVFYMFMNTLGFGLYFYYLNRARRYRGFFSKGGYGIVSFIGGFSLLINLAAATVFIASLIAKLPSPLYWMYQ